MCKVRETISERIRGLCKERNLTPYALAGQASVPLTTMFHLLDGTTKNPGIMTIVKVCNGLGITLEEFFATEEFQEVVETAEDEES